VNTPQLPLGLRFPAHQQLSAFVVADKGAALAAVQAAATEAAAPWVYLSGPPGSGKTHLLIGACQSPQGRHAQYLPLAGLGAHVEAALLATDDFELLCVDDLDAIVGMRGAEIALFDVFNRGRARGATIVFAAKQNPTRLGLVLPDLVSRLSSCAQFALKPLHEDQRRALLRERARQRGFELEDDVLDFLFRRHARDLGALFEVLDHLDRESLAAQRRITVPFLRRVIGRTERE
jgi:DnaA family protein